MKKKLLFITSLLTIINSMQAQTSIGINTLNPKDLFHIDGQGNTDQTNTTSDDIIFTSEGKMGIGTITPTETLEIIGKAKSTGNLETNNLTLNGGSKGLIKGKTTTTNEPITETTASLEIKSLKIEDPNLNQHKYATSNENGNLYWDYQRTDSKIVGLDSNRQPIPLYNPGNIKKIHKIYGTDTDIDITDNSLILTKGKWLIICKYVCRSSWNGNSTSPNGSNMLVWASLRAKPTSITETFNYDNSVEKVRYGFKPESSGWNIVTPQFTYLADLDEETEFKVFSLISVDTPEYYTLDEFGSKGSLFVAINLDDK